MVENESEERKGAGRRMDKAVLINLLTGVKSSHRTPPGHPTSPEIPAQSERRSIPADWHETSVPD